jgi:Holliday junction resolvase RusA-like endonuclease
VNLLTLKTFAFTVPLAPPSGNHYKKPSRRGGFLSFYHTPEAKAWFDAVALVAYGMEVFGTEHAVEYRVYRGKGSRGDLDNYSKCILDGLQRAGVIKNDDTVVEMHGYKFRDRENPRTEIIIRALNEGGRKCKTRTHTTK